MKYLFILGRNPELSIKELESYFKKSDNQIIDFSQRENAVMVELENPLDAGAVDFLGGTIAIGIVLCSLKDIDKKEIYVSEKNNFAYAIWSFSEHTEEISKYLKLRFRKEKLKATEKKVRESMDMQKGEKGQAISSKVDEEYFVYGDFFGKIIQKCNYKKIEERDMKKPVRRESLSISPRLAKIIINLSGVRENQILVDAFCGIGVVLQEALLQDIKVIGIDKDSNAIAGANENLEWFKFSKSNYDLINNDSSKINLKNFKISGMASEPDLGEILKKIPSKEKANELIKRYELITISVLNNMKKYVKGKIVITAPFIKTINKRIGCDFNNILNKTGLKIVKGFPIQEFRENQIVGRQIIVFENN